VYFVRRGDRIKGPLSPEKLRGLRADGRLRRRDEIAPSPAGPWSRLADCYEEVLGDAGRDDDAADQSSGFGELFADADGGDYRGGPAIGNSARGGGGKIAARAGKGAPADVAAGKAEGLAALVGTAGLFRQPYVFWGAIAGTALVSGLSAFALAALLGAFSSERHDQIAREITAEANAARPTAPPPRPEPAGPAPAAGAAAPTPRTAARPVAAPPEGAGGDATGAATDGGSLPGDDPGAPPRVVEKSVDPAVEQGAAIKELLEGYYTAADWPTRYRLTVPGEQAKRLMKLLYADVDWVAVQWSVSRMPEQQELVAAARGRKPVRIDTVLNGNPHHILVVWADGRWRVDWMESLETLWLAK